MRTAVAAAELILSFISVTAPASEAPAAESAKAAYSTGVTDIGTLLDDPAARAVLDEHIPSISKGDNINMARSLTLRVLQQYAANILTDQMLRQIDADLAKLPAK